jgi:hypothetical protein
MFLVTEFFLNSNYPSLDGVSLGGNSQAPQAYVPQRKRSVTFASEIGGVNDVARLPIINDEASEAGADNDNVFTEIDQVTAPMSYREEGERLLSEAMEAREMEENLESHKVSSLSGGVVFFILRRNGSR